MTSGFILAAYAVVANDSIQTLGTFLSSNQNIKWYWLTLYAGSILCLILSYGWYINDGDIAWGRLNRIPRPDEFTIFHAIAPAALLLLTRFGIPVSTTFLVLSVFATGKTVESMVAKSVAGYVIAVITALLIWSILARYLNERHQPQGSHRKYWVIAQWVATGFLWANWLMHDMANISAYLPRKLSLGYLDRDTCVDYGIFRNHFLCQGRQNPIDCSFKNEYALHPERYHHRYRLHPVLWGFKEYNDIPIALPGYLWVFLQEERRRSGEPIRMPVRQELYFPCFSKTSLRLW